MAKKTDRPAGDSPGRASKPEKEMPRFLIPAKAGKWVGSYAGVGLEFRLTDEETGKPVHFVLCGADLRELIATAGQVQAELDSESEDADEEE